MNCLVAIAYAASIIIRDDVPDVQYRALALQPQFAAVSRVVADSAGSGSGVLVAPRWVVTAAHVVANAKSAALSVLINGERLHVVRVVVHPQYAQHTGFARTPYDQALLEFERAPDVVPAAIDAQLPDTGTLVTMVGYGVGGIGARDSAGTRRAATNRIDQVGGALRSIQLGVNLLLMDFDVAGQPASSVMGSAIPEPLEGLASGGDSGGGLFVYRDNTWWLTGTFSVSSVTIAAAASRNFGGSINIFVGISANRDWINAVIRQEPQRE